MNKLAHMNFTKEGQKYVNSVLNPMKFRLAMFKTLPSIFFWGAKVKSIDTTRCEIIVPYRWSTQNPFKSIYFAAQCGVGEISTGLILDAMLRGRGSWSMLVIDFNAKFTKKAVSAVTYTCEDGPQVYDAICKAESTGEPQIIRMKTIGRMSDGVIVGHLELTWSIKKRS